MGKHAPLRLDKYLEIHEKAIRDLEGRGFLLEADLELAPFGDDFLVMTGVIYCASEIRLEVSKQLHLTGNEPLAQTFAYTYNAVLRGGGTILRYNSPHPNHNKFHHVHRYDVLSGDKEGTTTELSEAERPTLAQVVQELHDWYYDNYTAVRAALQAP